VQTEERKLIHCMVYTKHSTLAASWALHDAWIRVLDANDWGKIDISRIHGAY
jgi:hypothetical protein